MKALVLEDVQRLSVQNVPDPELHTGGALLRVKANGVCRSDWHAWIGDIPRDYPWILGHEMTGVVEEVADDVTRFEPGDRVVVPFMGSDGTCEYCQAGHSNVCDHMMIPGRTYAGGYAEYVSVPLADRNLVKLPEAVSFEDGAALGCRFITSFHALVDRAGLAPGEWVAVYGCGGVGLSAINIASGLGARVIGVDINDDNLELARDMGAEILINSQSTPSVEAIMDITGGGAHVAIDALGIPATCVNGILSLRKLGRHLQIGMTTKKEGGYMSLPTDQIVYRELKMIGSLGMPPHRFDAMLSMLAKGALNPGRMVTARTSLSGVESVFQAMTQFQTTGTSVVTQFE